MVSDTEAGVVGRHGGGTQSGVVGVGGQNQSQAFKAGSFWLTHVYPRDHSPTGSRNRASSWVTKRFNTGVCWETFISKPSYLVPSQEISHSNWALTLHNSLIPSPPAKKLRNKNVSGVWSFQKMKACPITWWAKMPGRVGCNSCSNVCLTIHGYGFWIHRLSQPQNKAFEKSVLNMYRLAPTRHYFLSCVVEQCFT